MIRKSRDRRGARLAAVALAVGAILLATMVPTGHDPALTPLFCLVCGGKGVADVVSNVILFMPLGLALAALGTRRRRAIFAGAALSLCVEFTQQFIPGRDPSLSDLVFNTTGTALGFAALRLAPRLIDPPAAVASRLALAAAAFAAGVLGLTAASFSPAFPESTYYAQWTPDLRHLAQYDGTVLDVELAGLRLPPPRLDESPRVARLLRDGQPLRVTAIAGTPPPSLASIFSIHDDRRREIILIGAEGDDLVLRVRTRAAALRLDHPDLRLPGALADFRPGDTITITVQRRVGQAGFCVGLNGGVSCGSSYPVGFGWSLLLYSDRIPKAGGFLLSAGWLAALVAPVAFWARRRWEAALAAAILVGALVAAAAGTPAVSFAPADAVGLTAGIAAGLGARRLAAGRRRSGR